MGRKNRNTRQKSIIARELQKIDSFFNAEVLHEKVRKKDPDIGMATIYRFLSEAKNKGELFTYTCDRKTTYSKGKKSHCHFLCEKTGKVVHFEIDNIDFLKDKIPGTIRSFQLEVRGECDRCSEK